MDFHFLDFVFDSMSFLKDVVDCLQAQLGTDDWTKTVRSEFEIRLSNGSRVIVAKCTIRAPRLQSVEVCCKGRKLTITRTPFVGSPRVRMSWVNSKGKTMEQGLAIMLAAIE